MSNCPYASYSTMDATYYHKPMTCISPLNTPIPQYDSQFNMSSNIMNKIYYLTGIYPTPHNTNANPQSPEYQNIFDQISAIHAQYNPPMNEREQLLFAIQLLTTTVIDYNLYLDVNPNDREAIKLFNEYRNQLMMLTREFEQKYGPISLSSETLNQYPWNWLKGPWPWEA